MNCTCHCHTAPPKHAIKGKAELQNGHKFEWLQFIDGSLSLAAATAKAIQIVTAQHAGAIKDCHA
jgi:hypothetical protein